MKRILIVDNEADITRLVSDTIRDAFTHFEVVQHNDWAEAVFEIEESKPFDLVITDFHMPRGREGLTLTNAVRRVSNTTKIILMSSDVTERDMEDIHPDRFLPKPIKLDFLIAMVKDLLPELEPRPV